MPEADPLSVARGIALARLTVRAHSTHELRQALDKKKTPPEVIDELVERFTEVGLLNDQSFAAAWVESRLNHRGTSARVLRQELRAKGVPDEIIAEAVRVVDHEAELDAARALAAKKGRSLATLDEPVARRRLMGALARRGYQSSVVAQVVREAMAERGDGAEPTDW